VSAKYNLVCDQATTFNFQFQILNNTIPWNLNGYTTTVVASTANGRMVLSQNDGRVTVTIDAETTGAITAARYAYDLVLDSGSEVTRLLEGKFIVTGAVTT
jgi:hypothetical protein